MNQFVKKGWLSVFRNIEIGQEIYFSMMCSYCSGERLFSKLNLIKNHLRSTMKDDGLEVKVLNMIEFDDTFNDFADKKLRKQCSAKPS